LVGAFFISFTKKYVKSDGRGLQILLLMVAVATATQYDEKF